VKWDVKSLSENESANDAEACVRIAAMNERIVFMGSPEFAIPSLEALHEKYELVAVVTQPDRPAGRGRTLTPCAVKHARWSLAYPSYNRCLSRNSAL